MKDSSPQIAKLIDTELHEAWPHEAQHFTPWLHDNIEHLSEAVGLELEASDTEVNVDGFAADIIATVADTDERVLIENQLERSDHKHLGQILTYLAGTKASAVIWIAKGFHEAHLSAINWLNEHTTDEFAFFAVRVRVVRIGNSPLAPIFEVIERPNTWERKLASKSNAAHSEITQLRMEFWNRYLELYPGTFEPQKGSNVWIQMLRDEPIYLSLALTSKYCGMFLRGGHGADPKVFEEWIEAHKEELKPLGDLHSAANHHYYTSWHGCGNARKG